jgi:hypothetical protein
MGGDRLVMLSQQPPISARICCARAGLSRENKTPPLRMVWSPVLFNKEHPSASLRFPRTTLAVAFFWADWNRSQPRSVFVGVP